MLYIYGARNLHTRKSLTPALHLPDPSLGVRVGDARSAVDRVDSEQDPLTLLRFERYHALEPIRPRAPVAATLSGNNGLELEVGVRVPKPNATRLRLEADIGVLLAVPRVRLL